MTLQSTPAAYSSVNDNLIYVAYDAAYTGVNYKYVGELWINGNKEFTSKVFPNQDGRGVFNFGAVVREYIEVKLAPNASGILAQELAINEFNTSVVVKLRQEIAGVLSAVLLTDSERIFFNHYNGRINGFTELGNYSDSVISNRSSNFDLLFNSNKFYIPFFSETSNDVDVNIEVLTSTFTSTISPNYTDSVQIINISPQAIINDFGGIINANTKEYSINIGSNTYKVRLVCAGLYTNYTVHFLNKWGGFESMLFNKARKRSIEAEKKQYQQLPYRVSNAGVVSLKSGDIMHTQNTNFALNFKEKLKISTDWVSDIDYQWMQQLITSPMVYLEDNGTLYPVTITENNYEIKQYITDKLTNLTIGIEFGTSFKTQFR